MKKRYNYQPINVINNSFEFNAPAPNEETFIKAKEDRGVRTETLWRRARFALQPSGGNQVDGSPPVCSFLSSASNKDFYLTYDYYLILSSIED